MTMVIIGLIAGLILLMLAIKYLPAFLSWEKLDTSGWDETWFSILDSDLFWIMVIAGLFLFAGTLPKKARIPFYGIAVLIAFGWVYASFSPGFDRGIRFAKRCVNSECSPDAEYFKTYNGGVMTVDEGASETAYLDGEVRIPIPIGHCLDISPEGAFWLRWDPGIDNAYVRPKSGTKTLGTVTALHASQCQLQTM